MPLSHGDLKLDVFRLLAWSICMPALACWPFLSAMPAFTLMGSGLSTLQIVVNALLLITGFWPLLQHASSTCSSVSRRQRSGNGPLAIADYCSGLSRRFGRVCI